MPKKKPPKKKPVDLAKKFKPGKALKPQPKKKKRKKKSAAADPAARSQDELNELIVDGGLARIELYKTLATRIKGGEQLKPSELKLWNEISREIEQGAIDQNGKKQKAVKPGPVIKSYDEAADYCGVSKQTIHANISRGNIKQEKDGTFKRADLDAWQAKRSGKKTDPKIQSILEKKEKADLRIRLAKANIQEMIAAGMRGEMAPWKDIVSEWAWRVKVVATGLEAFADRLPPLLVGRSQNEIRDILKDEVHTLRDMYARDGKYTPSKIKKKKRK